jgi:NADH-quinone oxidoreductase subunit E
LSACACEKVELTKEDAALDELLNQYRDYEGGIIPVLQEAQNIYGYLPKEVLQKIAKELKMPFSKVFGIVTFYAQFHLKPRGRYIARICLGTACHVRGTQIFFDIFQAAGGGCGRPLPRGDYSGGNKIRSEHCSWR